MVFKCKMCGGSLEVQEGMTICECEYCGTEQTIPTVKEEELQILFNRANVLRMKSEFDKATDIYEKILQRSESEAEAYWGLILCKYGIEYVEDPSTFKRVPTCHRASYDAVMADDDYHSAIKYADMTQKTIYESEAKAIDEIQKGIITLAQKEDPYDVFICYKETDEFGKRTQDSVIANDIYHQLTQEGFKVFYAAITLEDKLGTEYESYIFSALNTAKVMLAIGTKPEYFNAVWVKNEWSRFLKVIKKDRSKLLIPCYKGMDPYELPEEFSHLQAQDMSKIGFINDLVRGIKKVIVRESEQKDQEPVIIQNTGNTTANAQVKRGNMALEDHDWQKADSFFEEALNIDPECAEAYIGKLLVKEKIAGFNYWLSAQKDKYRAVTPERLEACSEDNEYIAKKVHEFIVPGYYDEKDIRKEYYFDRCYDSALSCRKEQKERQLSALDSERLLTRAKQYAKGESAQQLKKARAEIEKVLDHRIAQAQKEDENNIAQVKAAYAAYLSEADKKAEAQNANARNQQEQDYQSAVTAMKEASDIEAYESAKHRLELMDGYKDSSELAVKCQEEIQKEKERQEAIRREKAERAAKKMMRMIAIVATAVIVCAATVLVVNNVIIPNNHYREAAVLMDSGRTIEAAVAFGKLGDYRDARERSAECWNTIAVRENVSAGEYHTVGLRSDGTVVAAGDNEHGQCNVNDWKDIISLSAGGWHTVGLKSDGTVVAAGYNLFGQCDVNDWKDIIAVSASHYHTVGLRSDGTVVAVGDNWDGKCNVNDWKDIIAVSAGGWHTVGLKSDGTVVATGDNDYEKCDVGDWKDIIAVSAGGLHTVGLKSDGTVVAVGYHDFGQCAVYEWRDIIAVSAGADHTVGLRSDGTVVAVGSNNYGECNVYNWKDIIAVCAGDWYTVGLKSDGTVVATGDNSLGKCKVEGWTDIQNYEFGKVIHNTKNDKDMPETEQSYMGIYRVVDDEYIFLRKDPFVGAESLAQINGGEEVAVLEYGRSGFWKVNYKDLTGYVIPSRLEAVEVKDNPQAGNTQTVYVNTELLCMPVDGSDVLIDIPANEIVTAFDTAENGYILIEYNNTYGYIPTTACDEKSRNVVPGHYDCYYDNDPELGCDLSIYELTEQGEVYFEFFKVRAGGFGGTARVVENESYYTFDEDDQYGEIRMDDKGNIVFTLYSMNSYFESGTYYFDYDCSLEEWNNRYPTSLSPSLFENFLREYGDAGDSITYEFLGETKYVFYLPEKDYKDHFLLYKVRLSHGSIYYYVLGWGDDSDAYGVCKVLSGNKTELLWVN